MLLLEDQTHINYVLHRTERYQPGWEHGLPHRLEASMNLHISMGPLLSLIAGILIFIVPRLLNYIVAIYLIAMGLIGLFGTGALRGARCAERGLFARRIYIVPAGVNIASVRSGRADNPNHDCRYPFRDRLSCGSMVPRVACTKGPRVINDRQGSRAQARAKVPSTAPNVRVCTRMSRCCVSRRMRSMRVSTICATRQRQRSLPSSSRPRACSVIWSCRRSTFRAGRRSCRDS